MVHIKNISVILISFLLAFIVIELLVSIILKFPKNNLINVVTGARISYDGKTLLFEPFSKAYNFENGYNTYHLNNLGLHGTNVNISDTSEYIFILGNSFVKAAQMPPEMTASSILQKSLGYNNKFQVINLGEISCDPVDSYLRLNYFKDKYDIVPKYIFLIIDRLNYPYMADTNYIPQNLNDREYIYSSNSSNNIDRILLSSSSFLNLLKEAFSFSKKTTVGWIADDGFIDNKININGKYKNLEKMLQIFSESYKDKFIVVSISSNEFINNYLAEYSKFANIKFYQKNIISDEYRIKRKGHLNENGNRIFGEYLYDIIKGNINQ